MKTTIIIIIIAYTILTISFFLSLVNSRCKEFKDLNIEEDFDEWYFDKILDDIIKSMFWFCMLYMFLYLF